jgi:hypothetical protein
MAAKKKKSKLVARAQELEDAVARLFSGVAPPAKKTKKRKSKKAKVVKKAKSTARKTRKAAKGAVRKGKKAAKRVARKARKR